MRRDRYSGLSQSCGQGFPRLAALCFPLVLWGCGAPITVPPLDPQEVATFEAAGNFPHKVYRLEPGDKINIVYTFHREMNQADVIRPDGKISVKMAGELMVAGMTTSEVAKTLVAKTSDRLRNPEVVVTVSQFTEKTVFVGGEVGRPQKVTYRQGLTPLQAIIAAGGFLETARTDSVVLVRGGSENTFISRRLDLAGAVAEGAKEPLHLAPHDVVYVPRTGIAEANLWVKQHITDLFPFIVRGNLTGTAIRAFAGP